MSKENIEVVFRKLKYFLDKSLPVHFTEEDGTWHNGNLKDLVIEEALVVLIDIMPGRGMKIIPAESIIPDSIVEYIKKEEKR